MTLALLPKVPTAEEFLVLFNRLCVALREPADDSGVTQREYFTCLRDLPFAAVSAGADALKKEPGRKFFPTTAEWRTAAEKAHEALLRGAVKPRDEPWHDECAACQDTGWESHECDGGDRGVCGRKKTHAPHSFVVPCPCRPMNRTYQRHQKFGVGA